MKAILKYIPALAVIYLTACNKNHDKYISEIFPNQVGDHWTYIYRTSPAGTDTSVVNVDIIGSTFLPDGELASIWVTRISNAPFYHDTSLVVANLFGVRIFNNRICRTCLDKGPGELGRYALPLKVNNKWFTHFPSGDTTRVLSELSVQVPAGTFDHTFQVSRTIGYSTNSFTNDTMFITPHIGMTKFIKREFDLGTVPGDGIWELSDYHLN